MSSVLQNVTNKNKKKKVVAAEASKDSSALPSPKIGPVGNGNGHATPADEEGSTEKEHIREVAKHIRNVNKKLNSMTKVDAIIKENKNMSLDELVAARKINADQKAQALKKPQLQAQLASLEEQLALYRKLEADYESRLVKEKEAFEKSHASALESARTTARAEALAEADKTTKEKLLTLARFLAAAANRRNAGDESGNDARAFEGALFMVYSGDHNAVHNALKIIDGSEEMVPAVDGGYTGVTFARVKELACQEMPVTRETNWDAATSYNVESDPTIANAGLTELDDPTNAELVNGAAHMNIEDQTAPPPTGTIDEGASNAAADAMWDPTKPGAQEDPMVESYEIVPRDPAETETPTRTMTQSWSDEPVGDWATASMAENGDAATPVAENGKPNSNGDGFREVNRQHGNRGGRGWRGGSGSQHRGGFRGGRGGGGFRGGERGGRGRGGFRGGRGRGD